MAELCRGPAAVEGRLPAAGAAVLGCDRLSTARSSGACAGADAFTFVCAWQPGKSCNALLNRRGVQRCWAATGCPPRPRLAPVQVQMSHHVPGSLASPACPG